MIDLVQKQKIILKHRGCESNRHIADEPGIDKNAVIKNFVVTTINKNSQDSYIDMLPIW